MKCIFLLNKKKVYFSSWQLLTETSQVIQRVCSALLPISNVFSAPTIVNCQFSHPWILAFLHQVLLLLTPITCSGSNSPMLFPASSKIIPFSQNSIFCASNHLLYPTGKTVIHLWDRGTLTIAIYSRFLFPWYCPPNLRENLGSLAVERG